MNGTYDVAVIGGGIVGLATAMALTADSRAG
ncbi:FAD-dependent oxidoreductase, partial [Candidatus Poribacteria bacterium]|nr:FAD-dependent oxidoreductase [Candidatus Poribacteria bacterium]